MADLIPGSGTISKIYAGSSEVQKIYAGLDLVYPTGTPAADDWDTYEDGIYAYGYQDVQDSRYDLFGLSSYIQITEVSPSVAYEAPYRMRDNNQTGFQLLASGVLSPTPPYIAIWWERQGSVTQRAWFIGRFDAATQRYVYHDDSLGLGSYHAPTNASPEFAVVLLTQEPSNVANWRDYDGPGDYNTFAYGETLQVEMPSGTLFTPEVDPYPTDNLWSGVTRFRTGFNGIQLNGAVASFPTDVPYVAIWNITTSTWTVHAHVVDGGSSYQAYDKTTFDPPGASYPSAGDQVVMIGLRRYQAGEVANWSDWDPLLFPWQDFEDGRWLVDNLTYSSSDTWEIAPSSQAVGTGGVDWTWSYIGSSENCTGNSYAYRFRSVGTDPLIGTTDSKSLVVWETSTPSYGEHKIGYCANSRFYEGEGEFRDYGSSVPSNSMFMLMDQKLSRAIVRRLTPYDGPFANWDTYLNGFFISDVIGSSSSERIAVTSYPATTYSDYGSQIRVSSDSAPLSGAHYIEHSNYDPNQTLNDANMPPYIAVYFHVTQADGSYASMPPGWYVFKNEDQTFRPRSRTTWEKPVAWPTPSGNYNYIQAVVEAGYLSGSNAVRYLQHVFLDDYKDPEGQGGTDHWTRPPVVMSAEILSFNAGERIALDLPGSNPIYNVYGGIDNFSMYHYETIRESSGNTMWLARDAGGYGSVNVQLHHESVLVGESVWNATAGDNGVDFIVMTMGSTYPDHTDFYNTAAVGDRVFLTIYFNE